MTEDRAITVAPAAACFLAELGRRELRLPEPLEAELRQLCREPIWSADRLWERLQHGNRVLDAHGDHDAPDVLWTRWEGIFAAWWCCEQAREDLAEREQARRQRQSGPRFNWSR